ncbi:MULTISPECIES: cyclic nucleotide-binding domain-containing protein [Rhodomicrobium]|uniref:cyclic nucleotide-binding domain-containing protein n=1 Tax=Rhodomicrobium TaxID=1068 RepID=UPI000B4AF9E3|nr:MULTISPECIES: cyclic nucleotide-binding domain-containing protein [Rhodomicrobium]
MALDKNAELLGSVPLFHGLAVEQLTAIATKSKKSFFEANATILSSGTQGQTAYLILSGRAVTKPREGSRLEAEPLEAGTLIGEMAMLVETEYTLDVVAESRVRALAISRDELFEVMEDDPSIAHHLSEQITERLIFLACDLREVDQRFAMLEATLDNVIASVG